MLQDTLIFLGDYVDGWSQSPQVLDYLIDLSTTNSCVFMRNHDELLLHWLKKNLLWYWYNHGGKQLYAKVNSLTKQRHKSFDRTKRLSPR
jgi:serine/threonine protein phosphatase 1